jgi:hypothetical protein
MIFLIKEFVRWVYRLDSWMMGLARKRRKMVVTTLSAVAQA